MKEEKPCDQNGNLNGGAGGRRTFAFLIECVGVFQEEGRKDLYGFYTTIFHTSDTINESAATLPNLLLKKMASAGLCQNQSGISRTRCRIVEIHSSPATQDLGFEADGLSLYKMGVIDQLTKAIVFRFHGIAWPHMRVAI